MRMWMVAPARMCDRHLLGEHAECHMLAGTLAKQRSIAGFVEKGLLEPGSVAERHDALAVEMRARGFHHRSPLPQPDTAHLPHGHATAKVDARRAARDLAERCERCRSALVDPQPCRPPGSAGVR